MLESVVTEMAKFGPVWLVFGIVISGLSTIIVYLWKHINKLDERIYELQNKRVEDNKTYNDELLANSAETNRMFHDMSLTLGALKDAVNMRAHK